MAIHYTHKSFKGDKAMKKDAKKEQRRNEKRLRKQKNNPKQTKQKIQQGKVMDINKPITLDDLTDPTPDVPLDYTYFP